MTFLEAIRSRILIADGAMGTLLGMEGYRRLPYCLANLEAPELVRKVHHEYAEAGAEVVETNTFWAGSIRLHSFGSNASTREICLKGAELAREGAPNAYVLGAIGPCGKPLAPVGILPEEQVFQDFAEQASALFEGGVDAIILETFSDLEEMGIAIQAVKSVCDLPIVACKSFIEDGETLAEGFPLHAARKMLELGADAVGANCVVGPQRMLDIVRWMSEVGETPVVAMPTPGMPQLVRGQQVYDVTPEYFGRAAARLADGGANLIGGCCGTTPAHIRALSDALQNRNLRKRTITKIMEEERKTPLPESEPSELSRKLFKKFVITVELDLPRGLETEKVLEGSRALKERGADLIDISDGARARLRMSPMAICHIIQRDVGIETMMHVACRDRNMLALQADLLGAHALGIRNVLPVTGDPTNIGDFPSATSVFDIDAIGLVGIISRFNEGRDLAGNSIGRKCAFTIAVAFNPVARDLNVELERLERKMAAGAHLIYTQPLFEMRDAEFACEIAQKYKRPIMVGVMPLRSYRHAEFMHNEVPGIRVPDWLRKRLAEAEESDALKIGIEVAQEFAAKLPSMAQGLYLMPPFGNWKVAERVMDAVLPAQSQRAASEKSS
ncbi:MAG TPA: bifunctional homocysteine S-methyltransferase/methylenetetrahydrofolate reductase [Fimbriimonadales bacterium]|nr:bifunctional homocysteine S-methyltransferase/methylenetetrahydrofolate reductase [Fimbriimonadales bacterium]